MDRRISIEAPLAPPCEDGLGPEEVTLLRACEEATAADLAAAGLGWGFPDAGDPRF